MELDALAYCRGASHTKALPGDAVPRFTEAFTAACDVCARNLDFLQWIDAIPFTNDLLIAFCQSGSIKAPRWGRGHRTLFHTDEEVWRGDCHDCQQRLALVDRYHAAMADAAPSKAI